MTAGLGGLLDAPPEVATVGVSLLDDALREQGAAVHPALWAPPPADLGAAVATVAGADTVAAANRDAVERLTTARPHLVDVLPAHEALDFPEDTYLHAGPPISWERASGPLRGALMGAAIFEGVAEDPDAAAALFESGRIGLAPCHEHGTVGPMAGVVSPSMQMFVLEDEVYGVEARCSLNEGMGKVLRYGAYGEEVIDRLRWQRESLGPLLREAVRRHGPIDVFVMIAQALQMGDEGHNRNRAGTSLFLREIAADLVAVDAPSNDIARCLRFIADNDHFFLNIVMPAGKAAADAARDIPHSSVVVAMARNGTDFGIRISGTGDEWFTAPAEVPAGLLFPGFEDDDANPDIGDSTITETMGIGGFAMAAAPAIVRFVGGEVAEAMAATMAMYGITVGEHPLFQLPTLDFRGTPVGIDASLVVRTGQLPSVNTGIAGKVAGTGQIGAGLVRPPYPVFAAGLARLAERIEESR